MIGPFQVFAMDGNAVFGLIAVAVWVWLSIASKKNKAERNTEPPPLVHTPGEPLSPQDELKKFFSDLENGTSAPTPDEEPAMHRAPPPPLPPPAPKRVMVRPVTRPAPHPAPVTTMPTPAAAVRAPVDAPPLAELPALAPIPELRIMEPALVRGAQARTSPAPGRPRLELLRSREGLQSAIVASEVLGAPLGLRR